jgi:rubrerythrin
MIKNLALFLLALTIVGCSKDKSTTGEPAQQAMGMYAKGFNEALDVNKSLLGYFDKVPEEGPTKGEKYNIFPSQNSAKSSLTTIKESFDQAKEAAPSTLAKLAPLSDEVFTSLTNLNSTYGEVHKYYDAEDYKDDDYAKGMELHKAITANAEATTKAIGALGDALSGIEDEQAIAELAKYEGNKKHSYWFRYFNVEAKKAVKAVESGDAAALAASLAAAETAQKGLAEFAAAAGDSPAKGAFDAYVASAERFTSALKKLNREVAADEPKNVDQLSSQVIDAYNGIIGITNSLYELEGNDLLK